MLVLSRKTGQEIVLAGEIRVRVLEIRGNRVRLGFDAPDSVRIQRAELVAAECSAIPAANPRLPRGATEHSQLV